MLPSITRVLAVAFAAITCVDAIPQAVTSAATSTAAPTTTSSSSSPSSSSICNNSPALCSRNYSDITYMGAHDSAFLRDASTGNSAAGNQYKNATLALDAGLRFLQAQVHNENGTLRLCHTSCGLLDAGPLEDWLALLATWISSHPSDVVTLLLVNSDNQASSEFATAFNAAGLSKFTYKPPSPSQWPTLQSMINQGTRLVSFITNIGPSTTSTPFLLSEFDYVFETPFTVTDLTGFNCTVDRPSTVDGSSIEAFSQGFLGLINHFKDQQVIGDLTVPDTSTIATVNSASTSTEGDLGLHIQLCNTQWNHRPSFVLVDFWDQGNVVQAADNSNGITQTSGRQDINATSSDSNSADTTSATRKLEQGAMIAFLAAALLML